MILIKLTDDMINRANIAADELGVLPTSFMYGEGNLIGYIGKEMVYKHLNVQPFEIPNYNFDFVYNARRFLVKAKSTNVEPKSYHQCSVAQVQISQDTDYYIFCRVMIPSKFGWILGYISRLDFLKHASFHKKGSMEGNNNYITKNNNYSIQIGKLTKIDNLLLPPPPKTQKQLGEFFI